MELNPCEAVKNNIAGTRRVAAAAERGGDQKIRAHLERQGGEPVERHGRDETRRGA